MSDHIERTHESRSLAGARRKQISEARRLAAEGYAPVGETLTVVNPEAAIEERVFRLVTIYRR